MQIDELHLNVSLLDILQELREQLAINNVPILQGKIIDSVNNIQVCCIYHNNGQERRPSAGIHKETGMYHCFACDTTKTLTEFISNCFGRDDAGVFGHHWLAKNFATFAVEQRKEIKLDYTRDNTNYRTDSSTTYVSDEELDSYRYYHPYMYKRGLTDDIIRLFEIGFDKRTQCITFPIRDISGHCLFIARRSVSSKYFNYPSGVFKPIYGIFELSKCSTFPNTIVVCESMLDALKVWTFGDYAVALNGLGSTSQYKALSELPCRELVLATDNDVAGLNARKKLRANIKNKLISEYVIPEDKKDLNELTLEEYMSMKKNLLTFS